MYTYMYTCTCSCTVHVDELTLAMAAAGIRRRICRSWSVSWAAARRGGRDGSPPPDASDGRESRTTVM